MFLEEKWGFKVALRWEIFLKDVKAVRLLGSNLFLIDLEII